MKVSVKVCDILSENSEALLMTIDGTIVEPGGSSAWGNVGQNVRRLWPNYMKEVEDHLDLPIPLGNSQIIDISDYSSGDRPSFNFIGAISALDHLGSGGHPSNYLVESLILAMGDLAFYKVKSILSTIPTGGWRVPIEKAVHIVETVRRKFTKWDTTWTIGDYNPERIQQIFPFAEQFGWSIEDQN
jgi:hypothetical protein